MARNVSLALIAIVTSIMLVATANSATVKRGSIVGKSVKYTKGSVTIDKKSSSYTIRLGSNFKTKRGPAVYLYLGNGRPQKRIGKLKATSGAQSYSVPRSVNPTSYSNLYIYCVPFKAVFGQARLR